MGFNYNITMDALWVLTYARAAAEEAGRSSTEPTDILLGLILRGEHGLGGVLLRRAAADPDHLPTLDELDWQDIPTEASFAGGLSEEGSAVLEAAMELARDLGTPYVASEHLLLALLELRSGSDVDEWFEEIGVSERAIWRQWMAIMLQMDGGSGGLGTTEMGSA